MRLDNLSSSDVLPVSDSDFALVSGIASAFEILAALTVLEIGVTVHIRTSRNFLLFQFVLQSVALQRVQVLSGTGEN